MPSGQSQTLPLILYWHYLDADNVEAAEVQIRKAFRMIESQGVRAQSAGPICYEMAMFAARFLGDKKLSDQAMDLGEKAPGKNDTKAVAEMAREYVWGERSKAIKLAERQLAKVEQDLDEGPLLDHMRDWYQRIVPELVE